MIRKAVVGLSLFLVAVPVLADKGLEDRMMHAASILQEIRGSLDAEAPGVLNNAYAVAVFPEFVNVGLVGGVKHGRGIVAKRLASGEWSKPAFARLTSGSFGLQFGVSMSQLLIVFKDPKAVEAISGGQFTIGADAAYAAGELGGSAGAATDNKFQNQTVAVARSKGLFMGVALEGGVLRIEKDSNVEFYNDSIGLDGRRLLNDTEVETPAVAQHFQIVLAESMPLLSEDATPASEGNPNTHRSNFDNANRSVSLGDSAPGGISPQSKLRSGAAQARAAPAPASAATPGASGLNDAANVAPLPQATTEGIWVTADGVQLPAGKPSENQRASGESRLSNELAGRARGALWDGARNLASDALHDNRDFRNAKLAAKAGGKLADAALSRGGSGASPKAAPPAPQPGASAGTGNWVEVPEPAHESASAISRQPAQLATDLPAAPANADAGRFVGPPSPSEWPQEWVRQQALNGACEQGS